MPRLRGIAERSFPLRSSRQIDCRIFFVIRSYGGVHCALGQFPGLAKMTRVGFSVGFERKSDIFKLRLAGKPTFLLSYRRGIGSDEGKSIRGIVQDEIVHISRLRLVDDLPGFVVALQGKSVVGE